jgi:hypothetical protein
LRNICRLVESELHSWSTLVRGNNTDTEALGKDHLANAVQKTPGI